MANGLLEQVVFVMSSQNQDRGPRLTYAHSLASMGDVGIRDHLMNATCLEIPSWTADLLQVLKLWSFFIMISKLICHQCFIFSVSNTFSFRDQLWVAHVQHQLPTNPEVSEVDDSLTGDKFCRLALYT